MNATSQQFLDQFAEMNQLNRKAIEMIDAEVAWLMNLREALGKMEDIFRRANDDINNNTIDIADRSQVATAFSQISEIEPAPVRLEGEPIWKVMRHVMGVEPKFTAADAGRAVEARLGRSLGPNKAQSIRNNLLRHPKTFRQNEDSSWTVISLGEA